MADTRTMAQLLQAPTEGYEDAIVVPAWDQFKDLIRACPHHGFSELHQLDTFYNALNSNDQDSLNSITGGNFLDKMPRDCLAIIERKSKVCYSCSKAIVAKVSTSTSTPGVSPDVAEIKDMVKALLLDKKNQSQAPATVKAVEESSVTVNYNQGIIGYRPSMIANQMRPPGFPPVQIYQNNQRNNQNRYNQNRGNNYNQGLIYQPPTYQSLAPQTQGVSKDDFQNYIKGNDAVMKNIQNQMTNLTDLLTKFMNANTTSTLASCSLPSNTVANPRSDLKAFTTRSSVSYDGPQVPPPPSSLPKVPLILGRPFLRTARALIDVHGEQMTLRRDDQSITFKVGDTKTFSYNIIESVNRVDVIDVARGEFSQ
nr:hypothetical protein [Tanacetum cinerariifolium]